MRLPEAFTPKLITTFREGYGAAELRADLLAGLTVAIVALPLAMALGIASGASPREGLITAARSSWSSARPESRARRSVRKPRRSTRNDPAGRRESGADRRRPHPDQQLARTRGGFGQIGQPERFRPAGLM